MQQTTVQRTIRFLVNQYYDVQKLRVEAFNRIVAFAGESQFSYENPVRFASHMRNETHQMDASQNIFETKKDSAKPSAIATQIITQKIKVPQEIGEVVWYHNSLHETEKQLAKRLDGWSKTTPIRTQHLATINGIGPILSSGIIAWISPISNFDSISKLWAYAGLSAVHYESKCDKGHKLLTTNKITKCPVRKNRDKEEKCNADIEESVFVNAPIKRKAGHHCLVNVKLKTLTWKIATSFEKQNPKKSYYRRLYDKQKQYYMNRADLKEQLEKKQKGAKGHIRNMTLRYVSKRFLADLWLAWRRLEHLDISKPWILSKGGHSDFEAFVPDKEVES